MIPTEHSREPVRELLELFDEGYVRLSNPREAEVLRGAGVPVALGPDWSRRGRMWWAPRWASMLLWYQHQDLLARFLRDAADREALLVVSAGDHLTIRAYLDSLPPS